MIPHRPKLGEKIFFFISGAIISSPFPILVNSIVSYALMINLPRFSATLISAALIAPVLEEFAKAYPLFFRHGETEKSIMILGFLTGLGFGIAEFLFYVYILKVPALIRVPTLLFHATNTMIIAHGIGQNKSFRFYLFAVWLHFLNNFSALYGNAWFVGGIFATIVSYAFAWYFYRKSTEQTIEHWT